MASLFRARQLSAPGTCTLRHADRHRQGGVRRPLSLAFPIWCYQKRFEEALFMRQALSDVSCRFVAADRRVLLLARWPTRKRLSTLPRLALRSIGLGKSARRRKTSDVVYVHRALPLSKQPLCDRIRFTPARRSSNPSKPRSNARRFVCRVNDAHGRGRSSSLCRPPWSFRTQVIDEKRAEGMSYRHLQPAYSVFKDENLRPVSLARSPVKIFLAENTHRTPR
jgi:hypothetical protein